MRLPREGNVGPVAACDSFVEYARLAAERLGLPYDEHEERRMAELWER